MEPSQTPLVVLASMGVIGPDVLVVDLGHLVNSRFDFDDAVWVTHSFRGEVGVHTGTVPVSRNRLRVQSHNDAEIFSYAMEEISGHPEVISHCDAFARTDLEFPLGGHDLGIFS